MGLMSQVPQHPQHHLHLQIQQAADDQLSSRHSSASDVSAPADSPTHAVTSEPSDDASAATL